MDGEDVEAVIDRLKVLTVALGLHALPGAICLQLQVRLHCGMLCIGLVSSPMVLQAELAASVHRLAHEQAQHRESKAKAIDLARNNLLS